MADVTINVAGAQDLLSEAMVVMGRVRNVTVTAHTGEPQPHPNAQSSRRKAAENAQVNKDLLYLAHLCRRAAAEVEAQYWKARGYNDLLEENS